MNTQVAIDACLNEIIQRPNCVLSFDKNLLELLPDILVENHGVTDGVGAKKLPPLERLFDSLGVADASQRNIAALPRLLLERGVEIAKYDTRSQSERTAKQTKDFDHWSEKSVDESVEAVITLQKDLGMGVHNAQKQRYDAHRDPANLRRYLRSVTTPPPSLIERIFRRTFWELRLGRWLSSGMLDPMLPSLSVGPRWVTEIEFFREIVGFKKHIGLDLFSDDPELVTAGDMHQMPFGDRHFQFVFLKNVVDKSYDIRKLVQELIRVTRPRGVIVIDQICGYGATTPLNRTDIQKASNLARIFSRFAKVELLVCEDVDISGMGDAAASGETRFNARLALRMP